ncbi:MAG: PcfJ domain-containing protein [Candidatus Magasanikbacteria bacterium]|nr:PcfJ domain-containing protein [Candidatus Magasanikbacteria bacterium]
MTPERIRHDYAKAEAASPAKASVEKLYQDTLAIFSEDVRSQKEPLISAAFNTLQARLSRQEGFLFGEQEQAILKLKLARYFQRENTVDENTLFDAIIETPNFISIEKGGLHRLLKIHEQKTLYKIAEIRKRRAEITGNQELNPYEAFFTTNSGKFYLAKLLNMPHLEKESDYMGHCVGTSDSYINRMKRGEIEIFSLRTVPVFNEKLGQMGELEGDSPILTIEYDPKNKIVIQIKKANDDLITNQDIAGLDLFGVIKQVGKTTTDTGEPRDFSNISPDELDDIEVKDQHLLTENGEVHYRDFNPNTESPYLKAGAMPLEGLSKIDVAKIAQIFIGIKVKPEEIAQKENEVNRGTKIYIGPLYPGIFKTLPDIINHIYSEFWFPEGKIRRGTVEIGGKTAKQLEAELVKAGFKISDSAKFMLNNQRKP